MNKKKIVKKENNIINFPSKLSQIEKEIEASRYNKVNIDHLKEQVDMLQKKLNGNGSKAIRLTNLIMRLIK